MKKKIFSEYTQKELLSLPYCKLDAKTSNVYDSLLIFPTSHKHDSGWRCMAIVGVRASIPIELLTTGADDLNWSVVQSEDYLDIRTDCCMKSGVLHYWGNYSAFEVGFPNSSIDIKIIKKG